ncbi:malate dehydrogenase, mitochondrial-like [Vanessa cardui]|uniref:malate dehydrogenase, mitochondrial-like n=1 Tax=Vanessa cardui TaxID=171605 RepID=UPI001F129A4E|nr:malate dehydrogenase, mitochondrial-like [Vanessa cardui]
MISHKLLPYTLFSKCLKRVQIVQCRSIQVTVIGAASEIGKNVAMLLKLNSLITRLHLYDDDNTVHGIGLDLARMPGGPTVTSFTGDNFLPPAVRYSRLVLLVSRMPRKLGYTRDQMLAANALPVLKICRTLPEHNPDAFFAISSNPINSIISFAAALLNSSKPFNKYKLFGITNIDTARARALLGNALNVNPRHLHLPVIGGHSDNTIVPLFSNILPSHYSISQNQAETLTRLVRKCGNEVLNLKAGVDAATLAMAWSINEFTEHLLEALCGGYSIVNSFTANPHFGTKFFSGPNKVGPTGIIETCSSFVMSDYERSLLDQAVPIINREVAQGEDYIREIEASKHF